MLVMLVTGTLNSILTKLQYKIPSDGMPFRHPYFITSMMFIGEALCYLAYLADKHYSGSMTSDDVSTTVSQPNPSNTLIQRLGSKVFALPGALDGVSTALMMIGLELTGVSVYQMLRGFLVVIVAVYSVLFLGRRLYRHQILGVLLVFAGVSIVGVGSIWLVESDAINPGLGAFLILLGQFIAAGIFVLEEKFFTQLTVSPLKAAGIEGIIGIFYVLLVLPILYVIPCYSTELCSGDGHVEDTPYAVKQLFLRWELVLTSLGCIFSISFFNWSGVSVTKNASSLARSTIDTARTLTVWITELALGWSSFSSIQLIGFLLLAVGTFIYNEILVLPWFGLKESVLQHQDEMANRSILTNDDLEDGKKLLEE